MSIRSILIISHEFPPLGGGAGRVTASLCEELASRGFAIEVWTQKPSGTIAHEGRSYAVRYFTTGRRSVFQTDLLSMGVFLCKVLFASLKSVRRRFGCVMSIMAIPSGIAGGIVARRLKIPHLIWYHGADIHANRPPGAGAIHRLVLRGIWWSTTAHYFPSDSLMKMAQSYASLKNTRIIGVAPRIVDRRDPVRHPKVELSERLFVFLGRMEEVKNPLLLIRALSLMITEFKMPKTRIALLGDGVLLSDARKLSLELGLGQNCIFTGYADGPRLISFLAKAYCLVLPSRAEAFPLTVLEAASFGVPTIGSDTVGIRDAVVNNQTGLLFPEGDTRKCAEAMSLLAGNLELRNKLGMNAQVRIEKFTIQKSADALERALKKISV